MTCDFTSFLTVFQSYQDDVRMIMKGCVPWNSIYGSHTRNALYKWINGCLAEVGFFHVMGNRYPIQVCFIIIWYKTEKDTIWQICLYSLNL